MLPFNCPDGMDCPDYHICNDNPEQRDVCPLTELLDPFETMQMPVDELIKS